MKTYKIKSAYDAVIASQTGQVFLDKNSTLTVDEEKIFSIYPVGLNTFLPFTLNIEDTRNNDFVKCVDVADTKYILLIPQPSIRGFSKVRQNVENNVCEIEIGRHVVTFSAERYAKEIKLDENFSKYQTGTVENVCFCLLTSELSQMLLFFNPQNGKVDKLYGEEIRLRDNAITVVAKSSSLTGVKSKAEYVINKDGVQKLSSTQILSGELVKNPRAICMAFLDLIKNDEIDLAEQYLSLSLRRQTEGKNLSAFFGKILHFFALEDDIFAVLTQNGIKKIDFKIVDAKIDEIESE